MGIAIDMIAEKIHGFLGKYLGYILQEIKIALFFV